MKEEFEDVFHEEEYDELLNRWEDMLKNKKKYFFDVFEFENIIDYYIDIDKANNALNAINLASEQHPSSINIQLKKAQVLVEKGLSNQALKIIDNIELIESSNSEVYLVKGTALNALNRYSEAEKAFDYAVSFSFEDKVDIMQSIANSFEHIGKYQISLKYLLEAFKIENDNLLLLFDIGYCYEKLGQIKKSIDFYNKYLDKEPFSENAWYNLGILYSKADMFDKAVEAYEFSLAINPEFSLAYFNLANAYSNNEDFQKAIINYKEYMNYDGINVEVLSYIGDCYESIKDYDTALKYYNDALQEDELFSDAFFGKANIMFQLGKYSDALELVTKSIQIDDMNAEYYFLLGNIYSELKNYKEACESHKKAYDIEPGEMDFIIALSDSYVKSNEYLLSKNILIEGLKDNKNSSLIYFRLAATYLHLDNKNQALEAFENGLKINSSDHAEILLTYPNAFDILEISKLIDNYILKDLN